MSSNNNNTTDSTALDAYSADDLLLSDLHYKVLRLWATTSLKHREIANELDTTEGTVHKYITDRLSMAKKAERQAKMCDETAEFLACIEEKQSK
jgi:DNA-directed RNA polymerase specialized sigma24 family protein